MTANCAYCGKEFTPTKNQKFSNRKYNTRLCCSAICGSHLSRPLLKGKNPWNKGKKTGIKPKGGFNTRFKKGHSGYWIGRKNENTPNWRGGTTSEIRKLRASLEYELWREAVFTRDNWTCQKTGIRGGKLHAHHINNFADYPEVRTSIENGITLSGKVHREFHQKYGMKNNTREQLEEFLRI